MRKAKENAKKGQKDVQERKKAMKVKMDIAWKIA